MRTEPLSPLNPLTMSQALGLLEDIVKEKGPDYKYPIDHMGSTMWSDEHIRELLIREEVDTQIKEASCLYFHPETREPLCIIGHLLKRVSVDVPLKFENHNIFDVFYSLNLPVMRKVVTLLRYVQQRQDTGYSWGKALELGKNQFIVEES